MIRTMTNDNAPSGNLYFFGQKPGVEFVGMKIDDDRCIMTIKLHMPRRSRMGIIVGAR